MSESSKRKEKANAITTVCVWLVVLVCMLLSPLSQNGVFSESTSAFLLMIFFGCVILCGVLIWVCYHREKRFTMSASMWAKVLLLAAVSNVMLNTATCTVPAMFAIGILSCGALFCICYALMRSWCILLLAPIFFLSLLLLGAYYQYGTVLTPDLIVQITSASETEIRDHVTPANITIITLVVAVSIAWAYVICRVLRRETRVSLLSAGSILGVAFYAAFFLGTPQYEQLAEHASPVGKVGKLCFLIQEGESERAKLRRLVTELPSPTEQPSSCEILKECQGVVCILHIGESVRADRMSLNGYKENDTTPWLAANSRLINFTDCVSSSKYTTESFITILTNGRRNPIHDFPQEMYPSTGSVVDLMAASGFKCSSVLSHGMGSLMDCINDCFLSRCQSVHRIGEKEHPETQLNIIRDIVADTEQENLFLLLNNLGSHSPFNAYDESKAIFLPSSGSAVFERPEASDEVHEKASNAYDNSIYLNLDCYVKGIAEQLQGRPYVYIYIGDHGESIGHNGVYLRDKYDFPESYYETRTCLVPFFIIASPEFERLHPHFAEKLRQLRANTSLRTHHEHIFHTLLGLFGVKTPWYEEALDLCSPHVKPYNGLHPDDTEHRGNGPLKRKQSNMMSL